MKSRGASSIRQRSIRRLGMAGDPCTIEDFYLEECLLGVKLAESSKSMDELRSKLEEQLPQNSPETRRSYAGRICRWLFPDGSLGSAPLLAWQAYRDEQILLDHFRVRYLEAVPLLGKFVSGVLASLDVGSSLRPESVRAFVSRECGTILP